MTQDLPTKLIAGAGTKKDRRIRMFPAVALVLCLVLPAYAKSVRCADGTTAKAGHGACSQNGGLAAPEPKAERPPADSVMCKDGTTVKAGPDACAHHGGAPEEAAASASGATARCKDGTYSHAEHREETCFRHGGVAKWMKSTR